MAERRQVSNVNTETLKKQRNLRSERKKTRTLQSQKYYGLTVEELATSEMEIIRFCQKKRYADEISSLKRGMNVKRTSYIHKLNPIL